MNYSITDECIIEEYLNNWFTYDELSQYLCIDVIRVNNVLNNISDLKLQEKVNRHKKLIADYYNYDGEVEGLDNYEETCNRLGIGRNVLQRNLTTRLRKIDALKADDANEILKYIVAKINNIFSDQ